MELYVWLTEKSFKNRFYKHRKSLTTENYHKNSLSNYVWKLKKRKEDYEISWKLLSKARPYSPSTKTCELCHRELYYIMYYNKSKATLNKRSEFFGYCLHKDKFLLKNQWINLKQLLTYKYVYYLSINFKFTSQVF